MADKTIEDLTEVTTVNKNGVVPIDDGTQTFKMKMSTLRKSFGGFDAVVGSTPGCTHASIPAVIADADLFGTNPRVLVAETQTITAEITIGFALSLEGLPNVSLVKSATTRCLKLDIEKIVIKNLRFQGWSTAGDKVITTTADGNYCRVQNCNFSALTDTDIDDALSVAGKKVIQFGNVIEV